MLPIALLRGALIVAGAILGAVLVAALVLRWGGLQDPVEIVGVPLLRGYSEALEQWSFYAFIATTVVLAAALARASRRTAGRVPASVVVPAGALALLVPPCLAAWGCWPSTLPGATACAAVAYLVGARGHERGRGSADRRRPVLAASLLIWGLGFPEMPVTLVSERRYFGPAVLTSLAFRMVYPRLPAALRGTHGDWRCALAALLVMSGTLLANGRELRFAAIGALGFLLGGLAGSARPRRPALGSPAWLAFVAVVGVRFSLDGQWAFLGPVRSALAVTGGAAAASVVGLAIPSGLAPRVRAWGASVRWRRWVPALAIGSIALTAIIRPWSGGLIAASALVVAARRPRRAWGVGWALALAGILMLAILPHEPNTTLDAFHDGQILSAVWEFESGRPLYAEVFPLRSYEFFLTWFSRRVAAPELANYFIAKSVLDGLPVAAVCLLTFAWTRSLAWSLATALAAATYPVMGGRNGLPLLLMALGVAVFRARSRAGLAWLVIGGWSAALLGFDMLVPLVGAATLTVLIAGPPGGPTRGSDRGLRTRPAAIRRAFGRVGWAALLLMAVLVPFLSALALWQGYRSATAYCWLLAENARYLPAFYGLPLPWDDIQQRRVMVAGLAMAGTWAAAGVVAWPSLAGARRRPWVFLLASYVLIAHRGLGRSDPSHLLILNFPNLVLGSLALFEGAKYLSRRGLRSPLVDRRVLAFAAMAWACWPTPQARLTPFDVARWVGDVRARAIDEPCRSPQVLARVGPCDTLWEIEGGLMSYVFRRHNPTRHAIAYCISSVGEQRVAVAALRDRPPKLIAWRSMSGPDNIPNPLRYYVISQYIYRHYRPLVVDHGSPFLEPAPPGWRGQFDLAPPFQAALPLGQLALRWGRERIPRLSADVLERQELAPDIGIGADHDGRTREARGRIDPRRRNYLRLDLAIAATGAGVPPARGVEAVLEFAPSGRDYDASARVTFNVVADGAVRPYLIPIGCSPGWSWRPGIEAIRVVLPAGHRLGPFRAECWQVDDIDPGPRDRRPIASPRPPPIPGPSGRR